jgi:hypothetical protein
MKRFLIILTLGFVILGTTGSSRLVKHFAEEGVEVDGVRLKHRRTVELELDLDDRLIYFAHVGDIRIRPTNGNQAILHIELVEYRPDDGEAYLDRDGKIRTRSQSDHPCVLGPLIAEIPRGLNLELGSGVGDIEIEGMDGSRKIVIETGMGDIVLEDLRNIISIDAETGMGEILLGPAKNLEEVDLATGMGSIKVRGVEAEVLDAATGMGGIRFNDCIFDRLYAETGMGSIKLKDTVYEDSDLDTGMGSVKYH